jgi:hypothetical protein
MKRLPPAFGMLVGGEDHFRNRWQQIFRNHQRTRGAFRQLARTSRAPLALESSLLGATRPRARAGARQNASRPHERIPAPLVPATRGCISTAPFESAFREHLSRAPFESTFRELARTSRAPLALESSLLGATSPPRSRGCISRAPFDSSREPSRAPLALELRLAGAARGRRTHQRVRERVDSAVRELRPLPSPAPLTRSPHPLLSPAPLARSSRPLLSPAPLARSSRPLLSPAPLTRSPSRTGIDPHIGRQTWGTRGRLSSP